MVDDQWQVAAGDLIVTRIPTARIQALRLRGFDNQTLEALDHALAFELPRNPNRAVGTSLRAIALAPGEWLIVGGTVHNDVLLAATTDAAVAHVADIGEGRVVYAVSGRRSRDLIAKACPIDLHPSAFGSGRAAQSVLAQVAVLIDQPSEEAVFHIYADASYAQHLNLWFTDAVLEFHIQDTD